MAVGCPDRKIWTFLHPENDSQLSEFSLKHPPCLVSSLPKHQAHLCDDHRPSSPQRCLGKLPSYKFWMQDNFLKMQKKQSVIYDMEMGSKKLSKDIRVMPSIELSLMHSYRKRRLSLKSPRKSNRTNSLNTFN